MPSILFNIVSSTSKLNLFQYIILLGCIIYIIDYMSYRNTRVQWYKDQFLKLTLNATAMPMSYHRLLIHEEGKDIRSLYYRNVTTYRNSSYPFISGDTFRALSDHVYDELRRDKLDRVSYGDIVFLKGDMLHKFFSGPYLSVNNSFVLISHNSDRSAPDMFKGILNDDRVIAWYASNPDLKHHKKLFPIPIGLANTQWTSGNFTAIMHAFKNYRKPWSERSILLYVNFSAYTNRMQRMAALLQAKTFKNVTIIETFISFDAYLQQLGDAKFVLSPPGNGLDTHRTWEALLMGASPVTITSELDSLFNKTTATILPEWRNLTEKFLLSRNLASYDNLMPTVLYARYWREKLRKYRSK
ncbi:unnamed protein product [Adineta steineri]|uniref:Uncharacterized protein n=1 Tax=Adineta steineri TaxID=433720 RepID=A0A818TZE1_9BILA|nr:unnamed protein product [Adineta steineri]CAF3690166.1 unnamed protein product [Adineta steineri]